LIPNKKQNEKKAKNKDCAMIHIDIVLNRNGTFTKGLIGVCDSFPIQIHSSGDAIFLYKVFLTLFKYTLKNINNRVVLVVRTLKSSGYAIDSYLMLWRKICLEMRNRWGLAWE